MDSTMTIAASGMAAAISSLTVSASNVANAGTSGPVPGLSAQGPYQLATVIQTPLAEGGVSVTVIRSPDYALTYAPAAPFANAQGMVAVPNIDVAAQMVNQMTASLAFRANAKVFQIAARNQKSLLDMLA